LKWGGVGIFIQENIKFSNINLLEFNKEQDLEISAVKLKILNKNVVVFCIYRSPVDDLDYFIKYIDKILNMFYNPRTEIIICGDFNINFMSNNNNYNKTRLEQVLSTYNLMGTVDFPTRITNTSSTLIDNIFIDAKNIYTMKTHINGISDHDGQIIKIDKFILLDNGGDPKVIRTANDHTTAQFQHLLSSEIWEDVFGTNDVDAMFQNFLNTYLRCFYATHSKRNISKANRTYKGWIAQGIKT
jgi:hypothetical protein